MIGCIGYIPNISLDEALNMPESNEAIVELLEKKNSEFTGIESVMCRFKDGELFILAQTGHPAYEMNEYLQHFIANADVAPKLQVLIKLNAQGGYTVGLIINPTIALKKNGIEVNQPQLTEYQDQEQEDDKIMFIQHVPSMFTQHGQFLQSELAGILTRVRNGEKIKTRFAWHDFMPGEITDEKIEFDIELFRPQSAELLFNTNLQQNWYEAVVEVIQTSLEGYNNIKPVIIV